MIRGCGGGCVSATSSACLHLFIVFTFGLESPRSSLDISLLSLFDSAVVIFTRPVLYCT
jgi:hypothetical protein